IADCIDSRIGGARIAMKDHRPRQRLGRTTRLVAWLLIPVMAVGPGCTRKHYREQADKQVGQILEHKSDDPRWNLPAYHVYPAPPPHPARFGDITNPDRPPMPPDDPAAHDYSPNPQHPPHKAGIARIEGVGYMQMLDTWDLLNRAEREERRKERQKAKDGEKE